MRFAHILNMIESVHASHSSAASVQTKRVMTMVKNERMGGYVPKWEMVEVKAETPKQEIEQNFAEAENSEPQNTPSSVALSYQPQDSFEASPKAPQEDFTFGDILDMANPLHHVPIVGHIYRSFTGDVIKPISTIVGSALFGGPIGLIGGLANAVSINETGKDLTGAAMDMVFAPRKEPKVQVADMQSDEAQNALQQPTEIAEAPAQQAKEHIELEGTVIAMADLRKPDSTAKAQTETAKTNNSDYPFMPRVPITELFISHDPRPLGEDNEQHYIR